MVKRRFVFASAIATLGLVLVIWGPFGWLVVSDIVHERVSRQRFEPEAWKSARNSFTGDVRIRMVDDLLRRHRFGGMTRKQVTNFIGEPDDTEYFKDWDMVYWLGPERGFMSIDSEWLVFRLDGPERVTYCRIVRD